MLDSDTSYIENESYKENSIAFSDEVRKGQILAQHLEDVGGK